jgi:ubiquinone biosynthesis protein UbiJ
MLTRLALPAINHLLAQQEWARQRLAPHAGAVVRLDAAPAQLRCRVDEDGLLAPATPDSEDAVVLSLPLEALPQVLQGGEDAMSQVRISGNAELADSLSFVFRHLSWDREADFARLLGPILGRRLHLAAAACQRALPEFGRRLAANAGEYLVHEGQLLVSSTAMDAHMAAMRELRDDLARLAQRVARVEKSVG